MPLTIYARAKYCPDDRSVSLVAAVIAQVSLATILVTLVLYRHAHGLQILLVYMYASSVFASAYTLAACTNTIIHLLRIVEDVDTPVGARIIPGYTTYRQLTILAKLAGKQVHAATILLPVLAWLAPVAAWRIHWKILDNLICTLWSRVQEKLDEARGTPCIAYIVWLAAQQAYTRGKLLPPQWSTKD